MTSLSKRIPDILYSLMDHRKAIQEHRVLVREYGSKFAFEDPVEQFRWVWSLVLHDWDKYLPWNYFWSSRYFQDKYSDLRVVFAAKKVFEKHAQRNRHHPEYWSGRYIPRLDLLEMCIDWWAMSMKHNESPIRWYRSNFKYPGEFLTEETKHKRPALHPETHKRVLQFFKEGSTIEQRKEVVKLWED
jgi:hypothetical protein